ncbi:MAG: carbohydrate ABC transporter permease [Oliverpabstia sp.]
MKKKKELKYNRERRRIIICFLIVPLAFLVYFTIYPVAMMFVYSFTNWKGSSTPYDFLGIKNYITIFTDDTYRTVFKTTAMYLAAGILQQIISLFLAVIMSENIRFGKLFKGIIFFPFIMNGVAVALAFRIFYQESGGLDTLLNFLHLGNYIQNWISNPKTVNFALCFIFLWKNIGYSFLIYLGTMQSVDRELYEAAAIDGAGAWKKFTAITFPNIKMIVGLMGTMSIINSITVFDVPYVLTSGQNGTSTFATKLVDTAFKYGQYGEACAMAIIMLAIAGVVMVFKNIFFKEETYV